MTAARVRSWLSTAAIVTAAAAACVQAALTAPFVGWGLAVARLGEVWGQRVLPGQLMVRRVYPGWQDELTLTGIGQIAYSNGRPEQGWGSYWLCLPNLAFTLLLAAAATCLHLGACRVLTSAGRGGGGEDGGGGGGGGGGAASTGRAAVVRWSALWGAGIFLLYEALRWFWAGAQRGALTQAVVGQRVAEIAFGPYGRASLMLGAVFAYAAALLWTARAFARPGPAAPGPLRARGWPPLPCACAAAGALLMTFPYWQGWGFVLLGEMPVHEVRSTLRSDWVARSVNAVAPMP